jgi:hypothetical protein
MKSNFLLYFSKLEISTRAHYQRNPMQNQLAKDKCIMQSFSPRATEQIIERKFEAEGK